MKNKEKRREKQTGNPADRLFWLGLLVMFLLFVVAPFSLCCSLENEMVEYTDYKPLVCETQYNG